MSATKLLIEVKGGSIIFVGSTTPEVEITLIDHDWEETQATQLDIDKVMTSEELQEHINNA